MGPILFIRRRGSFFSERKERLGCSKLRTISCTRLGPLFSTGSAGRHWTISWTCGCPDARSSSLTNLFTLRLPNDADRSASGTWALRTASPFEYMRKRDLVEAIAHDAHFRRENFV